MWAICPRWVSSRYWRAAPAAATAIRRFPLDSKAFERNGAEVFEEELAGRFIVESPIFPSCLHGSIGVSETVPDLIGKVAILR